MFLFWNTYAPRSSFRIQLRILVRQEAERRRRAFGTRTVAGHDKTPFGDGQNPTHQKGDDLGMVELLGLNNRGWYDILVHVTLWLFNIVMENGPFRDGLPIENGDFPWLC